MVKRVEENEQGRPAKNGKWVLLTLWGLVFAFALGLLGYYVFSPKSAPCPGDLVLPGGEKLGGDFEAVDENGDLVAQDEVITKPSLIYFGYTFCPDICPFDTARNAEVADVLKGRGIELTTIFVTVDPERDTPEVLKEYTSYVHDDMIGITGSIAQIDHLKSLYKAYGQKQASDKDDPEYYLVDHSAFSYFVTPEAGFVSAYSRGQSAEEIADNIQCQLEHLDG